MQSIHNPSNIESESITTVQSGIEVIDSTKTKTAFTYSPVSPVAAGAPSSPNQENEPEESSGEEDVVEFAMATGDGDGWSDVEESYTPSPPPDAWNGWSGPQPSEVLRRLMDRRSKNGTRWSEGTVVRFAEEFAALHQHCQCVSRQANYAADAILRIWNILFFGTPLPSRQPNLR